MTCLLCCPCSRRSGALLVGISDLVFGSAGLSAVCFLLYIISSEINNLQDNYYTSEYQERLHILTGMYWSVMLSYAFPALVTLLTGIFAVLAVSHNNDCCAITSILLTVIMVFACAGILLILFILRMEIIFLVPLIFGTIMHACFTFILLCYRANDLKMRYNI